MTAEQAYERADREVAHYLRLLAGSLSPAQRRTARLRLIRVVLARGAVQQMYDNAGIQLDKRGQYISRISILINGLDETELLNLGKQLSQKASATNS